MIMFMASCASSLERSWRLMTLAIKGFNILISLYDPQSQLQKAIEKFFSMLGEDGFGVELDAKGRVRAMLQAHDLAPDGCRRDSQFRGQRAVDHYDGCPHR